MTPATYGNNSSGFLAPKGCSIPNVVVKPLVETSLFLRSFSGVSGERSAWEILGETFT